MLKLHSKYTANRTVCGTVSNWLEMQFSFYDQSSPALEEKIALTTNYYLLISQFAVKLSAYAILLFHIAIFFLAIFRCTIMEKSSAHSL